MLPNGKRLVWAKNLLQRRERTVAIGESGWYGMGLMTDTTYGVTVVHHGGDLAGYHSDWFAFPDAQVGAVILTNADQGGPMRGAFMRRDPRGAVRRQTRSRRKRRFGRDAHVREYRRGAREADGARSAGCRAQLAEAYRSPDLGPLTVVRNATGVTFRFLAFSSHVATRKNDDGSPTFITIDPVTTAANSFPGPARAGRR